MMKMVIGVIVILLLSAGAVIGGAYMNHNEKVQERDKGEMKIDPQTQVFYQKLSKSLTAPMVKDGKVIAVLVTEATIEVVDEKLKEAIVAKEPKLQDAFLQVFYRHISDGNFDQDMLTEKVQAELRRDLLKASREVLGSDSITAVLLNDIQRQDT